MGAPVVICIVAKGNAVFQFGAKRMVSKGMLPPDKVLKRPGEINIKILQTSFSSVKALSSLQWVKLYFL